MSGENTTTIVDQNELLAAVTGLGDKFDATMEQRGADVKELGDGLRSEIAERDTKIEELSTQVSDLKRSLDDNRASLPGVEDEVKKGNVRIGQFLMASAIEAKTGNRDLAAQAFPLVAEIDQQVRKHIKKTDHTRALLAPEEMAGTRALTPEVATGAGFLSPEQVHGEFIRQVYSRTAFAAVGARTITGLDGASILRVNRQTGGATFGWTGIGSGPSSTTELTTGRVSFKPYKGYALTGITDEQLMMSGNVSIQGVVEDDLANQMRIGFDIAQLEGSGGEYQPLGLVGQLAAEGITDIDADDIPAATANGRWPHPDMWVVLRNTLEEADVPMDKYGSIMPTKSKNLIKRLYNVAGGAMTTPPTPDLHPHVPLLFGGINDAQLAEIIGPFGHSTHFEEGLTVGTSAACGRVAGGNWDMFFGVFWGPVLFKQSQHATIGSENAFTDDITFIKSSQLVDFGAVRPTDFRIMLGVSTEAVQIHNPARRDVRRALSRQDREQRGKESWRTA